jgi:hypothetical protein
MASYRVATDRMIGTGQGLEDVDKPDFQQYVVDNICKYYFDLLPVLGNRPNITPAFTNEVDEDSSNDNKNSNGSFDFAEDETESLFDEEGNKINGITNNAVIDMTDNNDCYESNDDHVSRKTNAGNKNKYIDIIDDEEDDYVDEFAGIKRSSTLINKTTTAMTDKNYTSSTTTRGESETTSQSSQSNKNGSPKKMASPPKRQKIYDDKPMTPIDAKRIQNDLIRKHKRQIHGKKMNSKNFGLMDQEETDRSFLKECRKQKMTFENNKLKYEKECKKEELILTQEKINIDKKRLDMDIQQSLLIQNKIKAETALNDQKMMLVKLQMFKEREAFKKANPSMSEDYLNSLFPL